MKFFTKSLGVIFMVMHIANFAQAQWYKSLSIGANHSISNTKIVSYDKSIEGTTLSSAKGIGFSIDAHIKRDVFNRFSIGAGLSLNTMQLSKSQSFSNLPVYLIANYNICEGKSYPFVFAGYGYALPYTKTLNRGRYMGFGVGYIFKNRFQVQLQSIHQNAEDISYVTDKGGVNLRGGQARFNNIALRVGWVF